MADEQFSLKDKVVKGLLWLGTAAFIAQSISWVSTVIVIRLLLPSDYGLMAMSGTFIFLITTISSLGINASLIQAEQLDDEDIRRVFGVVLVALSICALFCYFIAPAIAAFYKEDRLILIIRVMIINFCLVGFYLVPQSIVIREMNFSLKAKIDTFAQLGASISTLLLALKGRGVWSLVIGIVILHLIKMIGYNISTTCPRIPLFNLRKSKKFISYGVTVTGDRLLYSFFNQIDIIIIGRMLGDKLLGIYSVAMNLASLPSGKVLPILNQVSFTSYSRIQKDNERVRRNVLRVTRVISGVSFPVFFGMAGIAPYMIPLLLGEQWVSTIIPFQLLCIMLPIKTLSIILPPVVFALGEAKVNFFNMLMICCVMTIAFFIGVQWGILGVCIAWVVVYPVALLITTIRCLKVIGLPIGKILSEIKFPFWASALMLVIVYFCRNLVAGLPYGMPMFSLIALGVIIYSTMVLILYKNQYLEILKLLK